jgi:hypothetical protein
MGPTHRLFLVDWVQLSVRVALLDVVYDLLAQFWEAQSNLGTGQRGKF